MKVEVGGLSGDEGGGDGWGGESENTQRLPQTKQPTSFYLAMRENMNRASICSI